MKYSLPGFGVLSDPTAEFGLLAASARLPVIMWKCIDGSSLFADLTQESHLLVGGQVGSGVTAFVGSLVAGLLLTKTPSDVRMVLVDTRGDMLASFAGISHLLPSSCVETNPDRAVEALRWAVGEMERRYTLLAKAGSRNVESYNVKQVTTRPRSGILPYIVIVLCELADLMHGRVRKIERLLQELAPLARGVGMHLVVATQYPFPRVITSTVRAGLTSRVAFRTSNAAESRGILGDEGAEKLEDGRGMLVALLCDSPSFRCIAADSLSDEEISTLCTHARSQG